LVPYRESLEQDGKENEKPETGNRKLVNSAGFTFPVFGFLFSIPSLFGSGSAGLGNEGEQTQGQKHTRKRVRDTRP
jgi:hypothetical protein